MTAARRRLIDSLLAGALERQPSSREAFLRSATSDEAVREEVLRILEAHNEAYEEERRPPESAEASTALDSPERVLSVGATIAGRFEVIGILGAGGMGEVYHAQDRKLKRAVALKVVSRRRSADPDGTRRFLHEARAASALNHPNIATVYDIGEERGIEYIAMEYVQGKSLDKIIPSGGLPVPEALAYARQIAEALAAAHAAGIIHRDVKPGNIMVSPGGAVKVLDFGLALRHFAEGADLTATQSVAIKGEVVGTLAYMSPEQAEGRRVDTRTDIFSFGCVLYEMLTSRRPFLGDSQAGTLAAILHKEPERLRHLIHRRQSGWNLWSWVACGKMPQTAFSRWGTSAPNSRCGKRDERRFPWRGSLRCCWL